MSKNEENSELGLWIQDGIDIENRTIDLDGDITKDVVSKISRALFVMENKNTNPITIYINSDGGMVNVANGLHDTIRACSSHIITIARGEVMSSATDIFLAGDERISYKNTIFMFHTSSDSNSGKIFERSDALDIEKRQFDDCCEMYADRTGYKNKAWWKAWLQYRDRYLMVKEAKELGVIHKIIG